MPGRNQHPARSPAPARALAARRSRRTLPGRGRSVLADARREDERLFLPALAPRRSRAPPAEFPGASAPPTAPRATCSHRDQSFVEGEPMTRHSLPAVLLLLAIGALTHGAAQVSPSAKQGGPSPEDLARRAAVIKPRPDENRWQQIPWVTDVNQGLRQARAEKRPLLLWTILGEPLDEC